MKSSRRKQTNPNRVSSGVVDPENRTPSSSVQPESESKLEDNSPGQNPLDTQGNESPQNDSSSFPERPRTNNSYDMPMDLHVSSFNCPSCPEVFNNADDLREHKNDVHGQQPIKKMRMEEDTPDDFPTAYHRLGRELSENTDLPLPNGHPKPSDSSSTSPPFTESPPSLNHTPFPHQARTSPLATPRESGSPNQPSDMSMYSSKNTPEGNGEVHSNGKSERIFHMDAYCDLCDREFCNKYFLKTHKANKHGIYEDSSPPIGSVPLPMHGMMGVGGQEPQQQSPFNFKMEPSSIKHQSSHEEPLLPWSFKLDPPSPMSSKKPQDQPQHKPMESPLPMFPVPLPNIENTKYLGQNKSGNVQSSSSPDALVSSSTSMLNSITNSIKAAPPLNDPSMEDYCHICQKHFCNKYYLKKHKQDVHGIAPETPPNSSNKRPRSSLLDSMPMSSSANPMIMPQAMPGLSSMPNIHGMPNIPGMPNLPGMPNMPPGVMVLNPYHLPPVAIIPAGSLMPGQQIPPHHPIISQPLSMPSMSMSESSLAPHTSHAPLSSTASASSPSNQRQSPPSNGNKPPGLPQEDGAVHCNICGKEFCNEFYLHVHKESKHKVPKEELSSPRDKALPLVKDKRLSESNKSSPPPLSSTNQSSDAVNVPPMSPLNHLARPESGKLSCNMCNKDFNDFYLLHTHRIQEHGFPDMSDGSRLPGGELSEKDEAMRNMNRSLARMAADASAVSMASGFGPKPDKSQESAICDICNKEMTNQYFLRLHRFNVHGIDPSSNEKFERKPLSSPIPPSPISKTPPSSNSLPLSSSSQQPLNLAPINPIKQSMLPFLPPKIDFKDMPPFADFGRDFKGLRDMPPFLTETFNNELFARSQNRRHLDLNFFGFPSMGKMPGEDSVKLNFDPEAYCDICKKEFCSKYFLRTHKQNIHGIKCDVSSNSPYSSKSNELDKLTTTTSVMNGIGKPKDMTEKSSWKWKEPVNSSRVVCDICNKEVCNKYFLRTHKFKKHGIPPTSQSPNMSLSGSPVASDCDTASNTSSQPDEKPFRMDSILNMPQMIPLPPSDRLGDKFQNKNMNHMKGKDINQNNNGEYFETCNLCRKRFKNAKMLKEHIWKHHSMNDGMDPRAKNSPPIYPCQVCGIDFPAELSVQLHLIQEHNARVTLDTEEPQIPMEEPGLPNEEGGKACNFYGRNWGLRKSYGGHQRIRKFFCARCDFSTIWLSSLLEHEKSDHEVSSFEATGFKCKHCQQMEPSLMSLSNHLETVHGRSHEEMCEELKDVKFEPFTSHKCSHCPAVFTSHSRAVAHFREIHIRSRHDLNLKRSYQRSTLHCSTCSFKTHFISRLRRHAKNSSHKIHIPRIRSIPTTVIKTECNSSTPSPTTSSSSTENNNFHATTPTSIHFTSHDPSDTHDDDGLSRGVPGYKSITASLLSPPDCGGEHHRNVNLGDVPPRRDDIVLQTYSLPMSPVVMDTPPSFKLSNQPPGTSAVVGL